MYFQGKKHGIIQEYSQDKKLLDFTPYFMGEKCKCEGTRFDEK
jgi:hypothetical protein